MSAAEAAAPISAAEAKALFASLLRFPALVLAVSGGPDSTALLLLVARWRLRLKVAPKLLAVTVDHGLRRASAGEARAVKALARRLGVEAVYANRDYEPVAVARVGLGGHDPPVERLDRVSLYLPPAVALQVLPELTHKAIGQLWLNPGADSPEVVARARELGLPVVVGCSIVDIGVSPYDLD